MSLHFGRLPGPAVTREVLGTTACQADITPNSLKIKSKYRACASLFLFIKKVRAG